MEKSERDEKLDALNKAVADYVDKEVRRLRTERTFLQSVIDNSAEAAVQRSNLADEARSITNVRKLLGIK